MYIYYQISFSGGVFTDGWTGWLRVYIYVKLDIGVSFRLECRDNEILLRVLD